MISKSYTQSSKSSFVEERAFSFWFRTDNEKEK